MYDNILQLCEFEPLIIKIHQGDHECKGALYIAAYIFQRLYILAKDVIELEKQYVCTFKAFLKSRTSTLYVVLSLDRPSCSISV